MDVYNESVLHLWQVLNRYVVRYILVGGFAVNLHKYYRTTADINLYVENRSENRKKPGTALEELGISPKELIMRTQFIPGWAIMHLSNGFPLDIMTDVKGLEHFSFNECYALASSAVIEDVPVKFLHFNHLIASKKAANRPKDQIDVLALEEIKRIGETDKYMPQEIQLKSLIFI